MRFKTLILAVALLFQIGIFVSCGSSVPRITKEEKSTVITQIKEIPDVKDAKISQEGELVNLVLVVDSGTTEKRAKQLGDKFVRLVKTISQDENPGRQIDKGIYSYMIEVKDKQKKVKVEGIKIHGLKFLTWRKNK